MLLVDDMMKRIILAVFLLFSFQFALADIASDIKEGLSADAATQNAMAAAKAAGTELSATEIAKQLKDAGISDAGVIAAALVSAGFTNIGTITSALAAAGFTGSDIASVVANTPGVTTGSPGQSTSPSSTPASGGGSASAS